jgi:peptidoglycan-N-acetylglucosamine deacetylase
MSKLTWLVLLVSLGGPAVPRRAPEPPRTELWAFTGPWDPRSDSSLRSNSTRLDAAVTGWVGLDSVTARPILPSPFPDTIRLRGRTLRRMAIVTSWHGDRFHPSSIRSLARDRTRLGQIAGTIARHASAMRYGGLVLDFEDLRPSDLDALLRVVRSIADSARARRVSPIVVAVPAVDTEAYPARAIASVADFVMPMLYDQHWSTSKPGPISEPNWVRTALAARIAEVGSARIVAALPTYGYQWRPNRPAENVSFVEARRIAAGSGVPLVRDARTSTLRAVKPGAWELWVTDGTLLSSLVRQAEAAGVRRIALWRLGQEDPAALRALR